MERSCEVCSKPYQAQRASSRFCSSSCRGQAKHLRDSGVGPPARVSKAQAAAGVVPSLPVVSVPVPAGTGVAGVLRAELLAAGRLDTALGQSALCLADRIDLGQDTGSGLASLSRELRSAREAALEGVTGRVSELDAARAERQRRLGVA